MSFEQGGFLLDLLLFVDAPGLFVIFQRSDPCEPFLLFVQDLSGSSIETFSSFQDTKLLTLQTIHIVLMAMIKIEREEATVM